MAMGSTSLYFFYEDAPGGPPYCNQYCQIVEIYGTPPVSVFPTITGQNTVRYFGGQTPSGYATSIVLTSNAGGNTTWAVTAGATKIRLSSTTGAAITVTSTGTAFSSAIGDVFVTASIIIGEVNLTSAPFAITTRKPYRLVAGAPSTGCDSTYGYVSQLPYTIEDQLLTPLPTTTIVNEFWTTAIVNDYSGTNWRRGVAGSSPTNVAEFFDQIQGEISSQVPLAVCTGASTAVEHWGQKWFIGSATSGSGTPVQTDVLQKYTQHASHLSIVSPSN
jgi:hypothetical protein